MAALTPRTPSDRRGIVPPGRPRALPPAERRRLRVHRRGPHAQRSSPARTRSGYRCRRADLGTHRRLAPGRPPRSRMPVATAGHFTAARPKPAILTAIEKPGQPDLSCIVSGLMLKLARAAPRVGAIAHEPWGNLMAEVIDRLVVAMNAHDLDAAAGLINEDYRSDNGAPGQGLRRAGPDARQLGGHVRGDPRLSRRNLPVGPGR